MVDLEGPKKLCAGHVFTEPHNYQVAAVLQAQVGNDHGSVVMEMRGSKWAPSVD